MNPSLWIALIAAVPLAGFFTGAPRHSERALAAGIAAGVLWLLAAVLFLDWTSSLSLAFWVGASSGYAFRIVRQSEREHERLGAELSGRKAVRDGVLERLNATKKEAQHWEEEQHHSLAIYGIVKGLSEVLSWEAVRPKIETALEQHLRLDEFAFYVSDPQNGRMFPLLRKKLTSGVGSSWESLEKFWEKTRKDKTQAQVIEDGQRLIAIPILHSQEMVGYLAARVPRQADIAQTLEQAQEFVEEIAFALRRIRLFQEVEELSETDGLTGVYRRHKLDEKLKEETARAKVFKTGYCLMLIDVDHFKILNDTYGHVFGDIVLKRIGELLKSSVYETDFVARYGGEEFAILLPRAEPEGVLRKAEAIRARMHEEVFTQAMESVRITISTGIAHFPRDGQTPEEIVRKADQALYAAKLRGRNRVVDVIQA